MRQSNDLGLWAEVRTSLRSARAALFLDRDGVVVEEVDYLHRAEDIRLTPGAAAAIARANEAGISIVLVTNQAGVGRGYYGWEDFAAVQEALHAALARQGARLDAVYACGYHENGQGRLRISEHAWRKPNCGMLLAAADNLGIELSRSWIVGDRASDLEAGKRAGLPGGTLVATGHGAEPTERVAATALAGPEFAVDMAERLGVLSPAGAAGWSR